MDDDRFATPAARAAGLLLAFRDGDGLWRGRLASSALATATAVSAVALARRRPGAANDGVDLDRALAWLLADQQPDGGWGDTPESPANPSCTWLARAALELAAPAPRLAAGEARGRAVRAAEGYLDRTLGDTPAARRRALLARYGGDRTFAVPILANAALAGLVPWAGIPPLPVELACLPRGARRAARLEVVSYAEPALVAVGTLLADRAPPRAPWTRALRRLVRRRALARLPALQPASGGFLEAVPLTAFVAMALAARGNGAGDGAADGVVNRARAFLAAEQRADGSWPVDVDLSTWASSSALHALAHAGRPPTPADAARLVARQRRTVHPFTGAAPGGWGWTDRDGAVPDADDTAAALLALERSLADGGPPPPATMAAVRAGIAWLLALQNRDGGWPTFCRGWNRLPFDQSAPDLTAHVLRALAAWMPRLGAPDRIAGAAARAADAPGDEPPPAAARDHARAGTARAGARRASGPDNGAVKRGLRYLERTQREDGGWLPLWFGSQRAPDGANPVFGTARTLPALSACRRWRAGTGSDARGRRAGGFAPAPPAAALGDAADGHDLPVDAAERGVRFLLQAQGADGGWGATRECPPTREETALAVIALADWAETEDALADPAEPVRALRTRARAAAERGGDWLAARPVEPGDDGALPSGEPLGLYFASLWYDEALYAPIWMAEALGRLARRRPPPDGRAASANAAADGGRAVADAQGPATGDGEWRGDA